MGTIDRDSERSPPAELNAAGPLEMAIVLPAGVKKSLVAEIEGLTDLSFAGVS